MRANHGNVPRNAPRRGTRDKVKLHAVRSDPLLPRRPAPSCLGIDHTWASPSHFLPSQAWSALYFNKCSALARLCRIADLRKVCLCVKRKIR